MSEEHGISEDLAEKVELKYSFSTALGWLLLYTVLAASLLFIAWVGHDHEHRGFLIEFGVAIGFIGLAMMGLQSLFGGRFKTVAPNYGMDNILQFHREIGILATVLVLAHPVLLMIAEPEYFSFFDPRVNLMRAIALTFVVIAVPAITVSSIWRKIFKLSYEKWRLLHGFLGLAIVFVGVVHVIQVSHFMEPLWKKAAVVLIMGGCLYLVLHSRLVRPWKARELAYRVTEIAQERGDAWTISLAPLNSDRLNFVPGQFIWLTLGENPFSIRQHPFSITSSEKDTRLSITAKELGDHTKTFGSIDPGTRVFVEGPYGSFTPIPGYNLFLIMGGIGITPAMSMLRTMRDESDKRKAILLYANKEADGITFKEDLETLSGAIDLKVVHILEEANSDDPSKIEGRIDHELIGKYLPKNRSAYTYYICGPGALMDVAETSLRDHGIPWRNIYTERFEIV